MTDKDCITTQKESCKRYAKVHSLWNTESARIFFIQAKKKKKNFIAKAHFH